MKSVSVVNTWVCSFFLSEKAARSSCVCLHVRTHSRRSWGGGSWQRLSAEGSGIVYQEQCPHDCRWSSDRPLQNWQVKMSYLCHSGLNIKTFLTIVHWGCWFGVRCVISKTVHLVMFLDQEFFFKQTWERTRALRIQMCKFSVCLMLPSFCSQNSFQIAGLWPWECAARPGHPWQGFVRRSYASKYYTLSFLLLDLASNFMKRCLQQVMRAVWQQNQLHSWR